MTRETPIENLSRVRVRRARAGLQGRSDSLSVPDGAREDPAEPAIGDVRAPPAATGDGDQAGPPAGVDPLHQRTHRLDVGHGPELVAAREWAGRVRVADLGRLLPGRAPPGRVAGRRPADRPAALRAGRRGVR